MNRSVLLSVGVVVVLVGGAGVVGAPSQFAGAAPAPRQDAGSAEFVADFTSPDDLDLFDWQVFHGGVNPFPRSDQPRSWHGDHDMDCGGPTSLRQVDLVGETEPGPVGDAGDLVWWCGSRPSAPASSGHVMTSISAVAYAHIDFTPRRVFTDVSRVCWDQNWTEMGGRKWTQVTVVPEDIFQANNGRLEYVTLSLQEDVAVNGLPVTGDTWMLEMLKGSTQVQVGQSVTYTNFGGFTTTDKSYRFKHCAIDQGDGTVRLELERPGGNTEVRTAPGSFPRGQARVVFQDATYDSVKGTMPFDQAQQTNTWHWDNIEISTGDAGRAPTSPLPPGGGGGGGGAPGPGVPGGADGGPRLLDTRPGAGTGDGAAAGIGLRDAGSVYELQVAGRSGVPVDTRAVALNLTAVAASGHGYVTVWPCDEPMPNASNLNYLGPDPVAGSTIVKLSEAGTVCVLTAEASTHLIADLTGWFGDGAGFTARSGARLFDSRPGAATIDGDGRLGGLPGVGTVHEVQVTGRAGVPTGVSAVALTLTATDARGPGYATAWPCGEPQPNASNLNYAAGDTVANSALITVGADGRICLATAQESTHLIVDLTGSFTTGSDYRTRAGARVLDTRSQTGTIDGAHGGSGPIPAGSTYELQVTGRAGVPADATTVVLNLTSASATGWGYVTAWPCGQPQPNASSLNYTGAKATANTTLVGIGTGGRVCLFVAEQSTHLIADVNGWFVSGARFTPAATSTDEAQFQTTGLRTTTSPSADAAKFETAGLRSTASPSPLSSLLRSSISFFSSSSPPARTPDSLPDGWCGPSPSTADA